jgi:hypothetical protein
LAFARTLEFIKRAPAKHPRFLRDHVRHAFAYRH